MLTFALKTDATKLNTALGALARALEDWSPLWPLVGEIVRGIEREQFETEGARGVSGRWPALSARYAKAKARKYAGKTTLRASDRLYNSLTGFVAGDSVFDAAPKKLTVGTRVEYAVYHQSEGSRSRLPRRPILDLVPGRDDRAIAGVLKQHAQHLVQQAGFVVTSGGRGI